METDAFPDLLTAADQQVQSHETPYVAACYERLLTLGLTRNEALAEIAFVLGEEIDRMSRTRSAFNPFAYQARLAELPLPPDPELSAGAAE